LPAKIIIKMNISKIILLAAIFLLSSNVWAQKDTSNNSNRVTVFDNSPSTFREAKQGTKAKTVIKLNPLLFFDGDIPIYFEEVVNSSMTVEIAPGLTYDNFSQDIWESAASGSGIFNTPLQDVDGSTAGIGYSFKADIKYFPGTNNLLDGIYLSPEISYRHYSIDYPSNPANAGTASTIPGHTNKAELKLLLGHEAESDWIDNLFFDWYVGIGVRNTSALQYVPDANIPTQADRNSVSFTRPSFYFGIKIGIGF